MFLKTELETSPVQDILETGVFSQLAIALRSRSEKIMARWEAMIREILPTADKLTFAQLRDHLPQTLGKMAAALESSTAHETRHLISQTTDHGELRFHQGYNVEELIIEYRLLRRILIEEVESELGRRTSMEEDIALSMGMDTVLQQGVVALVYHQRQRLQAASQAEAKYLSFLSHDLRNNLNAVTLVLQVLRMELANQPQFQESLKDIESAQAAIEGTIDGMTRILRAERLQHGTAEPKIETVELRVLALDVARDAIPQADRKGVKLVVEIAQGLTVETDREWTKLVLQNLVGNAVKYSSKGTITIGGFACETKTGPEWALSVSDEGPGIAAEQTGKIFEAFKRGETHGQAGVGLGLAIASQAALLLGGKLQVESELGVGSTFSLAVSQV